MTSARELGFTPDLVQRGIEYLLRRHQIVRDERRRVAVASTYSAEKSIAEKIVALHRADVPQLTFDESIFGKLLDVEGKPIQPHERQLAAIATLATSPVMVLTGGPGTGKTSIVKAALEALSRNGITTFLCAPTGKAAVRIREQTGREAMTLHRLMKEHTDPESDELLTFPAGAVVVDESSMLGVPLFARFLQHIRPGTRLILVGDVDQLPPIDPGRPLYDVIHSGLVPVERLTEIYRTAKLSAIPHIARAINEGRTPPLNVAYPDFFWIEQGDPDMVAAWCVEAVATQAMQQLGVPPRDVQVIAAQKSQPMGVETLNFSLQMRLNPAQSAEYDVRIGGGYTARTGDRVMHTETNDYERNIFNGEIGYVAIADPNGVPPEEVQRLCPPPPSADGLEGLGLGAPPPPVSAEGKAKIVAVVDYGDRCVAYTRDQASDLLLAYAITVHKAQGSQAKVIVVPVHNRHAGMLTRNLVYTAVTRAERMVIAIGEERQLRKSVTNTRGQFRRTLLQEMLTQAARDYVAPEPSLGGVAAAPPLAPPALEVPAARGVDFGSLLAARRSAASTASVPTPPAPVPPAAFDFTAVLRPPETPPGTTLPLFPWSPKK